MSHLIVNSKSVICKCAELVNAVRVSKVTIVTGDLFLLGIELSIPFLRWLIHAPTLANPIQFDLRANR